MIRRHLVSALAVLALGLIMAAPAHAGGVSTGAIGVKKTANVKVKNETAKAYWVVIIMQGMAAPTTPAAAKNLGAYLLNPGKTVIYPVPAGNGAIAILDPALVPADPNGALPPPTAGCPFSVAKGKIAYAKIQAGPVVNLVPAF